MKSFVKKSGSADSLSQISFNPTSKAKHASDKAGVHYDLINAGLQTPYTVILPPYQSNPALIGVDFGMLGDIFVVKPAHGGGSEGVNLQVSSVEQIQQARMQFGRDTFLLQAAVHPTQLDGRPAWFRVIYCCGDVQVCWWDPQTHVYSPTKADLLPTGQIEAVQRISQTIADTLGMDIFSSEISLTDKGLLTIVDYVNDPLDLRLQSEAADGVPDEIVRRIAVKMADVVRKGKFNHFEEFGPGYSI